MEHSKRNRFHSVNIFLNRVAEVLIALFWSAMSAENILG